jgi:hypothetical protein
MSGRSDEVTSAEICAAAAHTDCVLRGLIACVTALTALGVSACSGSGGSVLPARADGDCVARVRFAGVIYTPNTNLNAKAPRGRALGHGSVIDCFGKNLDDAIPSRYRVVRIFAVRGVSPGTAIITGPGDAHGIYVDEDLRHPSQWPARIRRH